MIPTANKFAQAFNMLEKSGRLSDTDKRMLQFHYEVPERKLTPRQMSELMGWGGQSANRHYGKLARRITEELNWIPKPQTAPRSYYVEGLVIGSREESEFAWTLRPQVARALELLPWANLGHITVGSSDSDDDEFSSFEIIEQHRYRWHRLVERNSRGSRAAKEAHGYRCQACAFPFEKFYGRVGRDFIEAHHLIPLSELAFHEERSYLANDFAVLCSNCHRMIHRCRDPSDLDGYLENESAGGAELEIIRWCGSALLFRTQCFRNPSNSNPRNS
ncbi:MAG: 5-methylcytosine-specific restriction enzyme [Alphaproteobacteria bacterium]|jgi:5-methylcytosine-specific restriction protein A|nr:5-methylcytosine-specific restriction enzyme [Alphaproteobacteria bacterium]